LSLLNRSLMSLCSVPLLQADLLDVVQPLVRIHEDAGVVILLLIPLLLRLEALAKVAVLPKLIKQVEIAIFLIVIVKDAELRLFLTLETWSGGGRVWQPGSAF